MFRSTHLFNNAMYIFVTVIGRRPVQREWNTRDNSESDDQTMTLFIDSSDVGRVIGKLSTLSKIYLCTSQYFVSYSNLCLLKQIYIISLHINHTVVKPLCRLKYTQKSKFTVH